ncbi:unnamed protein product [Ranitomeya imitator]|uniref:Uncharacterized protein n=1 Tax=Ranitomeya imitator TaxID=111125 RepID=A0ABN9LAD8_9NEOB|nr:unnamed protein product [Ranitomeya imitator]
MSINKQYSLVPRVRCDGQDSAVFRAYYICDQGDSIMLHVNITLDLPYYMKMPTWKSRFGCTFIGLEVEEISLLCPSVCVCLDYHTIDCRDQGLPSLPNLFPLDIRKLVAANNHIQSIPGDLFLFYADLIYLDLRNNSLTSLEEGTFSSSTRLVFLDLSYNNLTQLDAGIFKSAEKLIKLSLGNNNLSEVHEDAFENLESLQVLELNDNNLQSLSVSALESLPSLRTIRLEGNPWACDCEFANLFFWIDENSNKLQKVRNVIKKWLLTGTVEVKIRSGRPSKILVRAARRIARKANQNPCLTAKDLQKDLADSGVVWN